MNKLELIGVDSVFASAPLNARGRDVRDEEEGVPDMRAWWSIDESSSEYLVMDRAIETLKEVIKAHGPFDGILGFSQGAGLASAICTHMNDFFPGHPPLKFVIFVGGFKLRSPLYQHLYEHGISLPTCHVIGDLDTIISPERSLQLAELCDQPTRVIVRHPGSHFVPSRPESVDAIADFVNGAVNGSLKATGGGF